MITFHFENHWKCLKDWIEFIFFTVIYDYKESEYQYLELTILNFEFVFYGEKNK